MEIFSTHRGSANFFNELVNDIKHKGNPRGFSFHRVTLQDALESGFLYKLQQKLPADDERQGMDEAEYFAFIRKGAADEETFLQEYMCVPSDDNSAFLSYDLIAGVEYKPGEAWQVPLKDCKEPLYVGVDVGRVTLLEQAFALSTKIGGLVVDHNTQVELKEIAATGMADAYERFINVCNREISKLVVGQDLSAAAAPTGLGSGVAALQSGVREDIRMFDQAKLAETVSRQLFAQFLQINGLPGSPPKPVWGGLSDADAKTLADLLVSLSQAGFEPTDESIPTLNDRFGFAVQRKAPPPAPTFGGIPGFPGPKTDSDLKPNDAEEDDQAEPDPSDAEDGEGEVETMAADSGGRWVTINGRHMFIKDGESVEEASKSLKSPDHQSGSSEGTRQVLTRKQSKSKRLTIDDVDHLMKQRGFKYKGSDIEHDQQTGKINTYLKFEGKDGKSVRYTMKEVRALITHAAQAPGLIVTLAAVGVDPIDQVAAARAAALGEAYRGAMAPFRQIILSSSSREECLRRLRQAYADWQPERLAAELETALQICAAEGK